jgi:hypothetical protein
MGNTPSKSEKKDKVAANRKLRRISKIKINMDEEPPALREVSNVWDFGKDGKKYYNKDEKFMRK